MAKTMIAAEELKNTFVDTWVDYLIPRIELAATLTTEAKRRDGMRASTSDTNIEGWKGLAQKLFKNCFDKYPAAKDRGYRQAKAVCKALLEQLPGSVEAGMVEASMNVWRSFNSHLNDLYEPFKQETRDDYAKRVEQRKSAGSKIEIDLSDALARAREILEKAARNELARTDWKNVSIALALVTGRRMAEIHCSAVFAVAGDYELDFSGRLKSGKQSDRDSVYRVPTLIPASLCFAGLAWMDANGKRIGRDEDPLRVNAVYSKELSRWIKQEWMLVHDEVWKQAETPEGEDFSQSKASMSYHKLRACYHAACKDNWLAAGNDIDDYIQAARGWLADDADASVESYKRLRLAKGSLSRA